MLFRSSDAIQKYLLNIGEVDFAGGMEAQSKTFAGRMSTLKDNVSLLSVEFGKIIIEAINPFIDKIGKLAESFKNLSPETKKTIVVIAALVAAIGPLVTVLGFIMSSIVPLFIKGLGLLSAAIGWVSASFKLLTATMIANPFTAIAVAIAAIVAAYVLWNKESDKVVKTQDALTQVNETAAQSIAAERAKLVELLAVARAEYISKEQRLKAVKELNAISPEYLGGLTLDKINTDEARIAVEKYNVALLETARVKAAQEKLTEIQSKKIDLELNQVKATTAAAEKQLELKTNQSLSAGQLNVLQTQHNQLVDISNTALVEQIATLTEEENILLGIITKNKEINTVIEGGNSALERRKAILLQGTLGISGAQKLGDTGYKKDNAYNVANFADAGSKINASLNTKPLIGFKDEVKGITEEIAVEIGRASCRERV